MLVEVRKKETVRSRKEAVKKKVFKQKKLSRIFFTYFFSPFFSFLLHTYLEILQEIKKFCNRLLDLEALHISD